jgi:hypothetical protein
MRYILFVVVVIILGSCTNDLKKFQVPENAAMSPLSIALYEDITKDNHRILNAGSKVYFTGDTAVVNDIHYAKVVWGDSSGYVQSSMLMPKGHWAVVTSPNHGIVELYGNAELDEVVENINNDWDLMVVGEANNNSVPVFYNNNEMGLTIHYVPSDLVFSDSLDIAFFKAYAESQRYPDDPAFVNLDLYKWRTMGFSDDGDDFNNSDYGDSGSTEAYLVAKERNWSNGDDPIPEDQYPGVIRKYFVLEDSTEIEAKGITLSGGYLYAEQDGAQVSDGKLVKAVRFEVTLNRPMDLRFEAESFDGPESRYNTQFSKIFNGAEANKPYSVFLGDTEENTMVLCSILRVTIFAGDVTAAATVSASCGD